MTDNQNIPFLDLASLHQELEKELILVFQKALRTAGFLGGPMVEEFESGLARFCEIAHCVGVSSGTDAVRFPLLVAGVEPGDIVLAVPLTFTGATKAISQAGRSSRDRLGLAVRPTNSTGLMAAHRRTH